MGLNELMRMIVIFVTFCLNKKKSHKDSEAKNIQINFHCKVKELLQWRITGLNVNIMTQYECVSCLAIAFIVAFVVVIHLQCLVSVYFSLVKIKKETLLTMFLSSHPVCIQSLSILQGQLKSHLHEAHFDIPS